jgi:uncharacterized membrane protein
MVIVGLMCLVRGLEIVWLLMIHPSRTYVISLFRRFEVTLGKEINTFDTVTYTFPSLVGYLISVTLNNESRHYYVVSDR